MRFEYYPEAYEPSQPTAKKVKQAKRLSAGYSLDAAELDDPFFKFITYKIYVLFLVCFNVICFGLAIAVLAATKRLIYLVPCAIHVAAAILIVTAIRLRQHILMWFAVALCLGAVLDAFVFMILSWVYCTQEYNINERGNGNFLLAVGFIFLLNLFIQAAGLGVAYKVNQGSLETNGILGNEEDVSENNGTDAESQPHEA